MLIFLAFSPHWKQKVFMSPIRVSSCPLAFLVELQVTWNLKRVQSTKVYPIFSEKLYQLIRLNLSDGEYKTFISQNYSEQRIINILLRLSRKWTQWKLPDFQITWKCSRILQKIKKITQFKLQLYARWLVPLKF